jgi:hypothetical protein
LKTVATSSGMSKSNRCSRSFSTKEKARENKSVSADLRV